MRLLLEGGALQLAAGSVALASLLLDLGWSEPALPNAWDPDDGLATQRLLTTGVAVVYVFSAVPAAVAFWRFTRAGTAARALQTCAGALLLLLVLELLLLLAVS